MGRSAPKFVRIKHDQYDAKYVGKTRDGRQFFLTTPFLPALDNQIGSEFIALYLFDAEGVLLEAKIDDLGPREKVDEAKARELIMKRLEELGEKKFCTIKIAPFVVRHFDVEFGLIAYQPEDSASWRVSVEPGNYMEFYSPWNGEYDT